TMAIANVQKEMLAGGKSNLVGDAQLYNTAAELTRIMGHKNPDKFFNDPSAINPQTGQLLHPPPAPPAPEPKLLAAQARAQTEQALAVHKAQVEQQQAQNAAVHLQVKTQAEIELAKIKADLDAKLKILDAHINVAARKPSQVPGARKAKRWPSLSPRPEAGGQISDGRSPWLIIRWSRSTISPTL